MAIAMIESRPLASSVVTRKPRGLCVFRTSDAPGSWQAMPPVVGLKGYNVVQTLAWVIGLELGYPLLERSDILGLDVRTWRRLGRKALFTRLLAIGARPVILALLLAVATSPVA